jgi:hypothetical protein
LPAAGARGGNPWLTVLSLEEQVARLENTEAIKRLQAQYAAACGDHYNPDKIIQLFTEDGVWDGTAVGLARVEGREAPRATSPPWGTTTVVARSDGRARHHSSH